MIFSELIPKKSMFLWNISYNNKKGLLLQVDFLVAVKLTHLVSDVVFEALHVLSGSYRLHQTFIV